ncbi:MAG: hypothetical protein HYX34_07950 [Actinobacteria bacterium]|nr:hypothetical protein [Actinomycetota bacterium]
MARLVWWRRRRIDEDGDGIDEAARDEGLAAGIGLLAGDAARRKVHDAARHRTCPNCGATASIEMLDLVERRTAWRCHVCAHAWEQSDIPA